MSKDEVLLQCDEEVQHLVEEIWTKVFESARNVLSHHDDFGFQLIEKKINPSLADTIAQLKKVETAFFLLRHTVDLDIATERQVLNSLQQIFLVKQIHWALQQNDSHEYEKAIGAVRNQAPF